MLAHVSLDDPAALNDSTLTLMFTEQGRNGALGGQSVPIDGTVSTARGNGGAWMAVRGKLPFGNWILRFEDTQAVRDLIKQGHIKDILFVVTYSGQLVPWPQ